MPPRHRRFLPRLFSTKMLFKRREVCRDEPTCSFRDAFIAGDFAGSGAAEFDDLGRRDYLMTPPLKYFDGNAHFYYHIRHRRAAIVER